MTGYEHAMLGVCGGLAIGLHRRYGWQVVATAGAAAVIPDWDGLSYLFGPQAFDRAHRVWGHNLWAVALAGALLAVLEYRFGWLDRAGRWLVKSFPVRRGGGGESFELPPVPRSSVGVWMAVGVIAALSHLAADVIFSGHARLADWGICLLWPWSERAWAYPRVPWGEPVVTILFAAGMLAMYFWPRRIQPIAIGALVLVTAYVVVRVPWFGAF